MKVYPKSDLKMCRKVILKCFKKVQKIPATLHKLSVDTFCDVLTRHCYKKHTYISKTSKKIASWGAPKSDIMEIELSPANEIF